MKVFFFSLLFFVSVQVSLAQVQLDSSLSACYALNGNAYEPISNLSGTLQNVAAVANRFQVANAALQFYCNANAMVILPNSPLLKTQELSVSFWLRPTASFYARGFILYTAFNGTASPAVSITRVLQNNGNYIVLQKQGATGSASLQSTSFIPASNWSHVVCAITNSQMAIYINGVAQGSIATTAGIQYSTNANVYLGSTNEPNHNEPFCGYLDNVRFYNRGLTAQEISALYTNDPACVTVTAAPVANFTVNPPICVGQPIQFMNLSTNFPDAFSWQISNSAFSNSTYENPTTTFSTAGIYSASLVVSNAIGTSSFAATFTVNPKPVVIAAANRTLTCRGLGATLLGFGANTYTWSNSVSQQSVFVDPHVTTTYTLTGTDTLGCTNTSTVLLKYVSDCFWSITEKESVPSLTVFPNPARESILLHLQNGTIMQMQLFNSLGEILKVDTLWLNDSESVLYVNELSPGLYYLNAKTSAGIKQVKIVID